MIAFVVAFIVSFSATWAATVAAFRWILMRRTNRRAVWSPEEWAAARRQGLL